MAESLLQLLGKAQQTEDLGEKRFFAVCHPGQEGLLPTCVQHPHHHLPEGRGKAHRILHQGTGPPEGSPGAGGPGARSPALTLSPLTARCEAAVQQEQQQVLLHQVGGPAGAGAGPGAG